MNLRLRLKRGFKLIELLAVLAILGIILLIAVPVFSNRITEAEEEVCEANRALVKKDYELSLTLSGDEHSAILFNYYLLGFDSDLCPDGGIFSFVERVINCSIHSSVDNPGDEIPWL